MADFQTINPATGKPIQKYSYQSVPELEKSIDNTQKAWINWKNSDFAERAKLLKDLAQILREQKETLGKLITTEMGKPLSQAVAEVEKCAWVCEYYAENGADFLKNDPIETDATKSFITYQPLGIVLAIMPWNFPFWQVFRFAAPGLMAGNAALLKHSPNTTECALKIQELFEQAGFPQHLFSTILADVTDMESIIANDYVKAVTLTGSTKAGKPVASLAGKYLKKTVLELGGSDPYIILDDADLDLAANKCVDGRLLNTGQSCIAAKRFIVTQKNAEAFTEKVLSLMTQKDFGDPMSDDYSLGTMARSDLRDQLHQQVTESISKGANCLIGGILPDTDGFYYPATLLSNVKQGMPAYNEELFGPVASILIAKDEEEALKIANDTSYGLGGAIFTRDLDKAEHLASTYLDAGCVFVNDFVKSDPRLPFGGIKQSGYGRELSPLGIKEFVNSKTVYLA